MNTNYFSQERHQQRTKDIRAESLQEAMEILRSEETGGVDYWGYTTFMVGYNHETGEKVTS